MDAHGAERRTFLGKVGVGTVGAAVFGTMLPIGATPAAAQVSALNDVTILNVALQLEYLEAEFYLRAVTGQGLPNSDISGVGVVGGVNGGGIVPFTSLVVAQVAADLAVDEQQHVRALRALVGPAAVARPLIDLAGGFQAAALAAGVIQPGQSFNPFADQDSFLLGAFLFEDLGVTAYAGAAALLSSAGNVSAAASILAVEGYHGGAVRTLLTQLGSSAAPFATQAFADLRSRATGAVTDVGIINPATGYVDIAPSDGNGLAYRRTPDQVINILALGNGATGKGGFFPTGLNVSPGLVHGPGIFN